MSTAAAPYYSSMEETLLLSLDEEQRGWFLRDMAIYRKDEVVGVLVAVFWGVSARTIFIFAATAWAFSTCVSSGQEFRGSSDWSRHFSCLAGCGDSTRRWRY